MDDDEVEAMMAEIVDDAAPGHYHEVMPALRRFCELAVDERSARAQLPDPDVDLRAYLTAHGAVLDLVDQTLELADLLKLWPGEDRDTPLRRN